AGVRRTGSLILGTAATPVLAAALLAAEWKLAKRGPQLAPIEFRSDGRVGGEGPAVRIVWLGDSLVTGVGASSADAAIPRLVARALGQPVDVVIRAVGGTGVQRVA